jgi:hypothetical protein
MIPAAPPLGLVRFSAHVMGAGTLVGSECDDCPVTEAVEVEKVPSTIYALPEFKGRDAAVLFPNPDFKVQRPPSRDRGRWSCVLHRLIISDANLPPYRDTVASADVLCLRYSTARTARTARAA